MYKKKHKRPRLTDYDLIVVGSGSGGGVAAHMSARLNKRVAIVDGGTVGGECPNYGCVPTKALLTAAQSFRQIKEARKFGVKATNVSVDLKAVQKWKNETVHNTGTYRGKKVFKDAGIDFISGHAHFLDPWTISVGKRRYSSHKFLIATGTYDVVPPSIEGLREAGYITYKQAIELEKLPKSIFIIGGGAIGCEFAQIFSSFGSRVHIAEFQPRLNPKEDPEVGLLLASVFEKGGISVHTSTRVTKVVAKNGRKTVTYMDGDKKRTATVDEVLLAAGKGAMVDLGLENAGISYDKHQIFTNNYMQTNRKHIYATGDVTGPYMFTHMASYQSRIAGHNMWHKQRKSADYHAVPRCIFTDPEVASVGRTEEELSQRNQAFQKTIVPISMVGRSNTSGHDDGFVKILATPAGNLLGGSIIAPRAGEMIHEIALATQMGLKASAIEQTIHAFPTWSEAVRIAASRIHCR